MKPLDSIMTTLHKYETMLAENSFVHLHRNQNDKKGWLDKTDENCSTMRWNAVIGAALATIGAAASIASPHMSEKSFQEGLQAAGLAFNKGGSVSESYFRSQTTGLESRCTVLHDGHKREEQEQMDAIHTAKKAQETMLAILQAAKGG